MIAKPIFHEKWWLESTSQGLQWGVVEINNGGLVIASMPWVLRQRFGIQVLTQPPLTQSLGPWLAEPQPGTKYSQRLAREKDLMETLINRLPDYHIFRQSFSPEITNWLPFHWHGFQQTTCYTYRLSDLSDIEIVWSSFRENIRREIRKAKKQAVKVERSSDIDSFLDVNELSFFRQKLKPPYSRAFVKNLFEACEKNNAGAIFLARGKDGRVHAGNLLIWNEHCAYYLMGGGDPELRNSGAASLAMWEAIQFASKVSKIFDFEGSMLEPVERFFRGFGAIQTPYFALSDIRSKRAASLMAARSLVQVWR